MHIFLDSADVIKSLLEIEDRGKSSGERLPCFPSGLAFEDLCKDAFDGSHVVVQHFWTGKATFPNTL